jgi:hypothetical protein
VFVIWGLPYGCASVYDLLQGQEFLPSTYPKISEIIPSWLPSIWLIIGVLAIIIVTFEGSYRLVRKMSQSNGIHSELQNEISEIISRLSTMKISTANAQGNYANMLIKCSKELSIGGITISHSPPTTYTDVKGNVILDYDRYGMTYGQKLEFLSQLRIDGIIEPNHFENYERFHLSGFGRQVVKYIKQTGHK